MGLPDPFVVHYGVVFTGPRTVILHPKSEGSCIHRERLVKPYVRLDMKVLEAERGVVMRVVMTRSDSMASPVKPSYDE